MFSTALVNTIPVYFRIKKVGVYGNSKNYPTEQLGEEFKVRKLTSFGTLVSFFTI